MKINFNDIKKLFAFPIFVFLLNVVLNNFFHPIYVEYRLDILTHFLGGMSIAYGAYYAIDIAKRADIIKIKNLFLKVLLILAIVMAAAVVWEFCEFFPDYLLGTNNQAKNFETMKDLIIGTVGGIVISLYFFRCEYYAL